jgi:hypothetical protein
MRLKAALIALALASLACMEQIATPTQVPTPSPSSPTPTPAPTATERPRTTEEAVNTVTIRAVVWIRSEPDGVRIGSLETGQSVELISCDGDWCEVRTDILSGYVFRGCTSDNPDELDCEAKP